MPDGIFRFADFELDSGRYELRRNQQPLKLEKIPMDLLFLLVETRGQLVTREQIIDRIWGKDVFLDTEHGINTAIRKIRQVLKDDPDEPRFIQTVTGKGYRFIAPLDHVPINGNGSGAKGIDAAEASPVDLRGGQRPDGAWLGRVAIAIAALLAVVAVLVGFNVAGSRNRLWPQTNRPVIQSLAVIPLENLSGDPKQDYFADGMTDEIITMLAKNSGLRVVSRTSVMQYKGAHRPLRDIARELGVDGILEGSVERLGNRVHLNAQLIHAGTDTHLWAESYDRDLNDVASLQTDLARTIARQVGQSTSTAVDAPKRIHPEAHDAYLLGRYHWFASEYSKSLEYFRKAIALQPDYAAAWAGIADCYTASSVEGEIPQREAIAQAEPAARKALAFDDSLAEAHHAMGAVHYFLQWDWGAADGELERSLELNPNSSETHHLRGYLMATLGRTDEALQEERRSIELDPFARPWALSLALYRAHQFDAAIAESRIRTGIAVNDGVMHNILGDIEWLRGRDAEAIAQWEQELRINGNEKRAAEMQKVFERGGMRAVLEWRLDRTLNAARRGYSSPLDFAYRYAYLKRKEETLKNLEAAYEERTPFLVHMQNEPVFDFLRSEARFEAIIKKMGLPLTKVWGHT